MQVLVLVEGQTEESFIKRELCPVYDSKGLYLRPTVIETKRILSGGGFRGGIGNFEQFKRHLVRLLGSATDSARFTVTTMIDYYRLPADFPGMSSRPSGSARVRVAHVEAAMHEAFGAKPNFVPYLSLHEFEALLFSSTTVIPSVMEDQEKSEAMRKVLQECLEPELINERPKSGPSDRIRMLFPRYQKRLHGSLAARRIPLDEMRSACSHFDSWLKNLEQRAGF